MMNKSERLIYLCGVIEYLSRHYAQPKTEILRLLGREVVTHFYQQADSYHLEATQNIPIYLEEVWNVMIPQGTQPTTDHLEWPLTNPFSVGRVYAKVIEHLKTDPIESMFILMSSWLCDMMDDYRTKIIFMPPLELAQSFTEGALIG